MKPRLLPYLRTIVSYVPDPSLLRLRRLGDVGTFKRPHEHDFRCFGHLDPDGQLFLDVGANRGQSIRSIRMVMGPIDIVAIEPNPILAESLSTDTSLSEHAELTVHNVALGAEHGGRLTLHVPRYGHTLYDTRASASEEQARQFLNQESFAFFDTERSGIETFDTPITTIDNLGVSPSILKIDVEGADFGVLVGGRTTIAANEPLTLIEEPSPESIEFMVELGYRPYRYLDDRLQADDTGGLNTFFLLPRHEADFQAVGLSVR